MQFIRRKPPTPVHPLMQAHLDLALPFVVATDHAIWGTFKDFRPATVLADRIAQVEPYGDRIAVLMHGTTVYQVPGQASISRQSTTRPTPGKAF